MDGIDGGGGACTRVGHRATGPRSRLPRPGGRCHPPAPPPRPPPLHAAHHGPASRPPPPSAPGSPHPDTPGSRWRAEEGGAGRNSSQRAGARLRRCGPARVGCPRSRARPPPHLQGRRGADGRDHVVEAGGAHGDENGLHGRRPPAPN